MIKLLIAKLALLGAFAIAGATFTLDALDKTALEGGYSDLATSFITNFITILVAAIPVLVVYGIYRGIRSFLK